MNITPEQYVERMINILQKKKELLQDILVLTESQTKVINEDSLEELRRLIDGKQSKIDDIDKLDEEFRVYFQRLKTALKITRLDELNASSLPGARLLKEATGDILGLIKRIGLLEKSNNQKGQQLLDSLKGEIKKMNLSKKANSAYVPKPFNIPSYFIDKKK